MKIKYLISFFFLMVISFQLKAFPTIACEKGVVSKNDTFDNIKKKCASVKVTISSKLSMSQGVQKKIKKIRLKFKNQSEIVLIYLNDQFLDSVTFNKN